MQDRSSDNRRRSEDRKNRSSLTNDISNFLGNSRLLFIIAAVSLFILIPILASIVVPYNSSKAEGTTNLSINSDGVLTAASVEKAEPKVLYSAEPGLVDDTIVKMQERLMALYYMDEDEPSTYYGQETEEAIKRFQRTHKLAMTGVADYNTFELLFSDDAKEYAVSEGAEGDDVESLQQRLVELDYLPTATGIFDETTTNAVKLFQQRNNLTPDGTIGTKTREALYAEDVNAYSIYKGEESEEIKELQQRLYDLGYLITVPDGKFGNDTVTAVKRFQEKHGLISDGHIGKQTKALILSNDAAPNSIGLGDSGSDVTKIQNRLKELGYLEGSSDGYFGEKTQNALKAFQKRNKLTSDGKYGAATGHVLFSSSAKKAPPKPTPKPAPKPASSSSGKSGSSSSSSGKSGSSSSSSGKDDSSSSSMPRSYSYSGPGSVSSLIKAAESRLGCPYVRGAKGPNKFDCSGLVYWCLNNAGVKQGYMTSFTWRSVTKYQRINSRSAVKAGDILVFKGHVAIAISNSMMIDASTSKGHVVKRTSYGSYWDTRWICAYRIF